MRSLLCVVAVLWPVWSAAVEPIDPADVPPELASWVPWVLGQHPDLACPIVARTRACVWPGQLDLDVRADEATWSLQVQADAAAELGLPGGDGAWPQDVRVDGRASLVTAQAGRPTIALTAGTHRVTGRMAWTTRPPALRMPTHLARVALQLDGVGVDEPAYDGALLRLGLQADDERQGDRLSLEVSRLVDDDIPVSVQTSVRVHASGRGREVDLGEVLVPGTRPVSLSADLPARFTEDGHLVIQARAGDWSFTFTALHEGPVTRLSRPTPPEPWPSTESWAVREHPDIRAITISGPPGVDPSRTTIPDAWRSLPVFTVDGSTPLVLEELRRGDPTPAPNSLTLRRTLWLDFDGGGFTAQDLFQGSMTQTWRLDADPSMHLGHVTATGTDGAVADRVITEGDTGASGVELRASGVGLQADSRYEPRPTTLPAVGWRTDVDSLSTSLMLPPGWTLLGGTGVDQISGSMFDRWSLFDLFFVLVLAMGTHRLLGWRWGLAMLGTMVLTRHTVGAPQWTWVLLLVIAALERVVSAGALAAVLRASKVVVGIAVVALVLPLAQEQLRTGLFPALGTPGGSHQVASRGLFDANFGEIQTQVGRSMAMEKHGDLSGTRSDAGAGIPAKPMSPMEAAADSRDAMDEADASYGSEAGVGLMAIIPRGRSHVVEVLGTTSSTAQVDPTDIVQTGPGVPSWSWTRHTLSWSGPVSQAQEIRLYLLSPTLNLLLALLRVSLIVAVGLRLLGLRSPAGLGRVNGAVASLVLAVALPWQPAHASPSADILEELEARLTVPPACGSDCVDVPTLHLAVADDILTITAQVHTDTTTSWPVPGPATAWVPAQVRVDGRPTTALARRTDGHLHVRLDQGVHEVVATGPLPRKDAVPLAFGERPHWLTWSGEGWAIDGLRADGAAPPSIQIARMLGDASTSQSAENLSPWLEVDRSLDLGLPWRVRTVVRRLGPPDHPVTVRVPLLSGESVMDDTVEPTDGYAPVTIERGQTAVVWNSTLEVTDELVLTAPEGVPWTETWHLSCSPIFACTPTGPAPITHLLAERWLPSWQVWPGESVRIAVSRPDGVLGQTTTLDAASLLVTPGRRQLAGELGFTVRSSQGGRQQVTLPGDAVLREVSIDGRPSPIELAADGTLSLSLPPGRHGVRASWIQERPASMWDTVPAVDLGHPAVNVRVEVVVPPERWIAALTGPRWGPVPMFWSHLLLVLATALLLARAPWSPLAAWQWALLGLGMTQVPVAAPIAVAAWFVALARRKLAPPSHALAFNAVQLGLVLLTLAAMISLYAAIHAGLLWQPDMQIEGPGSSASRLVWVMDRIDGAMPQPAVLWFPMWTWRVGMLLWSLWLASSLVRWLPWAWDAWISDGWVRTLPRRQKAAPVVPPPAVEE